MAFLMEDPGRAGRHSKWDLRLIHAYYINEAFDVNGHPIWMEESPDIIWRAREKVLPSLRVVQEREEQLQKSKSKNHGKQIWAEPELRPGRPWPTREAWQARREAGADLSTKGQDKIDRAASAAEERARQKLIEMGKIDA